MLSFSKVFNTHSKWKLPFKNRCLGLCLQRTQELMIFIHSVVCEFLKLTARCCCHWVSHLNSATRCLLLCTGLGLAVMYWKICVLYEFSHLWLGSRRPSVGGQLSLCLLLSIEYNIDKIHSGCIAGFSSVCYLMHELSYLKMCYCFTSVLWHTVYIPKVIPYWWSCLRDIFLLVGYVILQCCKYKYLS